MFRRGIGPECYPNQWPDEWNERKVGELMAESYKLRAFLKNEATDLIDNKGLALAGIRNEATVG